VTLSASELAEVVAALRALASTRGPDQQFAVRCLERLAEGASLTDAEVRRARVAEAEAFRPTSSAERARPADSLAQREADEALTRSRRRPGAATGSAPVA
jgi:hypothetical protein